jgi:hypothetical protein
MPPPASHFSAAIYAPSAPFAAENPAVLRLTPPSSHFSAAIYARGSKYAAENRSDRSVSRR